MLHRGWLAVLVAVAAICRSATGFRRISKGDAQTLLLANETAFAAAVPAWSTAWRASYESADDLTSGIEGVSAQAEGRIRLSELARSGGYAIQHELRKSDPDSSGSKRCESDSLEQMGTRIARGSTWYYGLSVYFLSTWEFNPGMYSDIIFQWKGFSGAPFMTLQQKYQGLYLRVQAGGRQFTVAADGLLGRWHDIRIRVHWETNASGVIEMEHKTHLESEYRRVVEFQGETMDRDAGGYLKWGLYRPDWKTEPNATAFSVRNIWHDNVAVGDSWEAVDPARSP